MRYVFHPAAEQAFNAQGSYECPWCSKNHAAVNVYPGVFLGGGHTEGIRRMSLPPGFQWDGVYRDGRWGWTIVRCIPVPRHRLLTPGAPN